LLQLPPAPLVPRGGTIDRLRSYLTATDEGPNKTAAFTDAEGRFELPCDAVLRQQAVQVDDDRISRPGKRQ